tara:strand:+ start:534 stop:1163 length:630 start_codon:yes stop_codon:yes gene_type:complete
LSRKKKTGGWRRSQREDFFLKKAQGRGLVSRAYFKLQELDAKFDLLKPNQNILELGAAPGGWVRYIEDELSGQENLYIAVDPLPVKSSGSAKVIRGKSNESRVSQEIEKILGSKKLDLVLSDMAPKISGVRIVDDNVSRELAGEALDIAFKYLAPGGKMVAKLFQGPEAQSVMAEIRKMFLKAVIFKPVASRSESREVFAVADGFKAER